MRHYNVYLNAKQAAYVAALKKALADSAIAPTLAKWLTNTCPECGDVAERNDGWHKIVDGYVAIGCEAYHVIDPRALGIKGYWDDWTLSH